MASRQFWTFGLASAALVALATPGIAGDLIYTPMNPSFGGSPLMSSHLLATANAQRDATASDAVDRLLGGGTGAAGTGAVAGSSDADLFIRQLQGRLLSALAGQVTNAIFPTDPANAPPSGTVQFGDTTVSFERTLTSIRLVIVNATDGTTTEIVVPQFVATAAN